MPKFTKFLISLGVLIFIIGGWITYTQYMMGFSIEIGMMIVGTGLAFWLIPWIRFYNSIKNTNNYNENNDGIYHHLCVFANKRYEIRLDTNNRTVFLHSEGREKTFNYSDIISAEGYLPRSGDAEKVEDNWHAYGLAINTKNLEKPVWSIKFYPQGLRGDQWIDQLNQECTAWMNILHKELEMKPR